MCVIISKVHSGQTKIIKSQCVCYQEAPPPPYNLENPQLEIIEIWLIKLFHVFNLGDGINSNISVVFNKQLSCNLLMCVALTVSFTVIH